MDLFEHVKNTFSNVKTRLKHNTYADLLWLVNIVPSFAGFSILGDTLWAPFWIAHLSLLMYIYGVGCAVYQIRDAQNTGDFIKSFVNVSLFVLIANNSYWFMMKRPLLKSTLADISKSDEMATVNVIFREKHERYLMRIKCILLIFYGFNVGNAAFVYLPHRVDVLNDYAMTPCYGMEPLSSSPNKEICMTLLCLQELSIMTVVLNYQALLLLLIAHTALLYHLLSDEIMTLNNFNKDELYNNPAAKEFLPVIIHRHSIILSVIFKLKALYSVPIGVNFGSNAVCISLFFYLPLQQWLQFMPILVYCFLVFFLYCFLCQRLSNAAEVFEMAVYACGWENFDINERKAVYVMLRQAQKPVELLAADIIPVNISTFATTLQAMFKFVTVVKF
uniref:Odorant receptor n=1 Tax=Conogethes punctiferalis TaxID=1133088 RepID=A0A1X9PEW2_CONPF|nr:odorant receptor 11 [Conogethes punctiferalis]